MTKSFQVLQKAEEKSTLSSDRPVPNLASNHHTSVRSRPPLSSRSVRNGLASLVYHAESVQRRARWRPRRCVLYAVAFFRGTGMHFSRERRDGVSTIRPSVNHPDAGSSWGGP